MQLNQVMCSALRTPLTGKGENSTSNRREQSTIVQSISAANNPSAGSVGAGSMGKGATTAGMQRLVQPAQDDRQKFRRYRFDSWKLVSLDAGRAGSQLHALSITQMCTPINHFISGAEGQDGSISGYLLECDNS
jgi:hypothetical protein